MPSTQRQLVAAPEAWDDTTEEYAFTILIWREGSTSYMARTANRHFNLDDIPSGEVIPTAALVGKWNDELTVASGHLSRAVHVKQVTDLAYAVYCNGVGPANDLGRELVREARLWEKVRAHPHKNLAEYLGCVRSGDFMTGLCFRRYQTTLTEVLRDSKLDPDRVMSSIASGIQHLHKLGVTHGDLNPSHIMFDEDGDVKIIDLDSASALGDEAPKKGSTPGWGGTADDDHPRTADYENLARICRALEERTSVQAASGGSS